MQSPELAADRPAPKGVLYYCVFRVMPDPIREEFINVALAMTDQAGTYSRLEFNPQIKTRLSQMGAATLHESLVNYFGRLKTNFDVAGHQILDPGLTSPALTKELLEGWTREHGSLLRLTQLRVFLSDQSDAAFEELYRRHIGTQRATELLAVEEEEAIAPEHERRTVISEFLRTLTRETNFDAGRVRRDQSFTGRSRHHWLDLVVTGNGGGPSFAHALPFRTRETKHLFLHRGAILDAAEDTGDQSLKLALYDEPPAERADLLRETSELLRANGVRLFRTGELGDAARLFDARLFDWH